MLIKEIVPKVLLFGTIPLYCLNKILDGAQEFHYGITVFLVELVEFVG